ncbi:hypothetical protein D3C79_1093180 [compost metagenome]
MVDRGQEIGFRLVKLPQLLDHLLLRAHQVALDEPVRHIAGNVLDQGDLGA